MELRVCIFEGDGAAPDAVEPMARLLDRIDVGVKVVNPPVKQRRAAVAAGIPPSELQAVIDTTEAVVFGATAGGHAGVFGLSATTVEGSG